jgi:hypothetical protein
MPSIPVVCLKAPRLERSNAPAAVAEKKPLCSAWASLSFLTKGSDNMALPLLKAEMERYLMSL